MKVYITKYALTKQGIIEITFPDGIEDNDSVFTTYPGEEGLDYLTKSQWYRTREEAVARAEGMRKRKIASLERQIKKLQEMEF
jgi:hypothetical protein